MGGRRSAGKWVALAVLLVLVIACIVLLKYVFVVRNVVVQGETDTSDQEIMRIASIGFGTSIFELDSREIEENINGTGTLCMEEVVIHYPDTVELYVRTRSKDAMLLHMGKIQILDESGVVVESLSEVPASDLVYVSGLHVVDCRIGEQLRANSGQMEAYCAVMRALSAHGAKMYASEIHLSDPEEIRLITRNGITVLLGNRENMLDKVAWMKSAVSDLENRGEGGGTLDVRSANKADYSRSGPDDAA